MFFGNFPVPAAQAKRVLSANRDSGTRRTRASAADRAA